jgi:hypothetical protein
MLSLAQTAGARRRFRLFVRGCELQKRRGEKRAAHSVTPMQARSKKGVR